ncbi:hypothetical protein ACIA5D_25505 [Actinoplanes sp. NPDC051513]|uniref:hypothetical protein n=1 Tax=Actinoplanes sp. NPDC051513 TaxID=3363908 RepID=UPI0037906D36
MEEPGTPPTPRPPTPRPRWLSPWMIAALAVVGVLALLGAGVAWVAAGGDGDDNATGRTPDATWSAPSASTQDAEAAVPPAGPRPSTYPVRTGNDLARVCDGWYYPQSPKFAGKAPHQISVGVVDSVLAPSRHMLSAVRVPEQKESIWRAWVPDNPAKSQLVACVDLTKAGKPLRNCKYKDQTPPMIALSQGVYRLRLYEAATGRKLLDKPVTGADGDCPSVVFLADGDSLYSEVNDTQLYGLLKGFVMRKGN